MRLYYSASIQSPGLLKHRRRTGFCGKASSGLGTAPSQSLGAALAKGSRIPAGHFLCTQVWGWGWPSQPTATYQQQNRSPPHHANLTITKLISSSSRFCQVIQHLQRAWEIGAEQALNARPLQAGVGAAGAPCERQEAWVCQTLTWSRSSPCFRVPASEDPKPTEEQMDHILKNHHQSAERGVGVAGNAASTSGNHGKTTSFWVILVPLNTCTLSALGLCTAAPLPMTLSPSFIL